MEESEISGGADGIAAGLNVSDTAEKNAEPAKMTSPKLNTRRWESV
ncbi:MAG: hypothetical protein LBK43_01915 [Treponema sp.]|jgi:hypothetical protein|nr:hypothetical protein [Treponema sp.]